MQEKKRKSISLGKKWLIVIFIGLAVFAGVFIVLILTRERLDYAGALDKTSSILSTKNDVVLFLDMDVEDLEFEDNEKEAIDKFKKALEENLSCMNLLDTSNVLKDEKVAEKYKISKEKSVKIKELSEIWADIELLQDLNDENLEKLKNSKSEKLKELANELSVYREKVSVFVETGDDIGLYGELLLTGDELVKKYENVSLDDILGMSRDDILDFYATIEELNKILSEKK